MTEKFESASKQEVLPTDEAFFDDPVLWLRAAIAYETGRSVSELSDSEIALRYNEGGFAEWDSRLAQAVYEYLKNIGYTDLRAT